MSFLPGTFPHISPANPKTRYVNTYSVTPVAATSFTVTVPAVDLAYMTRRQILVATSLETTGINDLTIGGVTAPRATNVAGNLCNFFSAHYEGVGPFNIVINYTAASSEASLIGVWEVADAGPLYRGDTDGDFLTGTAITQQTRIPKDSLLVATSMHVTDTVTYTWTGDVAERVDQDGGLLRVSNADNLTPAVASGDKTITATATASGIMGLLYKSILPNKNLLSTLRRSRNILNPSGGNSVSITGLDDSNLTDFKMLVFIAWEFAAGISTVTWVGAAMSLVHTISVAGASLSVWQIDVTDVNDIGNLVVTFNTTGTGTVSIIRYFCYNVGSIGAIDSDAATTGTGNALAVTVSEGGTILAEHIRGTDTQTITWTGAFEIRDEDEGDFRLGQAYYPHAAAETNRTIQAVGSGSGPWATLALALNPPS